MRVSNYCAKTLVGCPRCRKFVGTSRDRLLQKTESNVPLILLALLPRMERTPKETDFLSLRGEK